METVEARQGEEETSGPEASMGQALERIVLDSSSELKPRKKLVFPRESVSASAYQVPNVTKPRATPSPEAQSIAESAPAKPSPKKENAKPPKTSSTPVVPDLSNLDLPFPPPGIQVSSSPQSVDSVAPKKPAGHTVAAVKRQNLPVQKKKVIAKGRPTNQVRAKKSVKKVLIDKLAKSTDPGSKPDDLEAFLLEAERTEEREVRCRPQTLELLNQIALRTGCEPGDVAAQSISCIALAIQEAGFEFSLPMRAEVKAHSKK